MGLIVQDLLVNVVYTLIINKKKTNRRDLNIITLHNVMKRNMKTKLLTHIGIYQLISTTIGCSEIA